MNWTCFVSHILNCLVLKYNNMPAIENTCTVTRMCQLCSYVTYGTILTKRMAYQGKLKMRPYQSHMVMYQNTFIMPRRHLYLLKPVSMKITHYKKVLQQTSWLNYVKEKIAFLLEEHPQFGNLSNLSMVKILNFYKCSVLILHSCCCIVWSYFIN